MIGIAFSFDLGRYHANPWGEHVNEGLVEWPPSPWRILRSLYSVSRTNAQLAAVRDAADRALTRLLASDPPVYSLPASTEAHTRHYLPRRDWSPAQPGKTDLVLDAFRAVTPGDELIAWWPVELDDDELQALAHLAAALGHLGRSESVCSARLAPNGAPEDIAAEPATTQSEGEVVELLCPAPGAGIDDIAVPVGELRRRRHLKPPATREVPYEVRPPGPPVRRSVSVQSERPQLALFRLGGPNRPGIVEAVAVAQSLRSALQGRYGKRAGGSRSSTFSGREDTPRTDQHRHAHYVVLPDRSGRRVERLVAWAPEGFGEREVEALASLRQLVVRGAGDPLPVALAALGERDHVKLPELLGPASRWRSLTPFGLVRHPKLRGGQLREGPADQIRLELRRRALPEPSEVALIRGSWHRFRSSRVGASRLQRASVFGATLVFPTPVGGPLLLGTLCHFGLGAFRPDTLITLSE